jgi:flagellar biosynthesis anti-sigma factor FlgM
MRIDSGIPLQSKLEIERTQKKPAGGSQSGQASGVTSELSPDVVRLSSLEVQAESAPDVRQEKVNALRDAISSGTYQVSNESLADAILRDVLKQ